jgi:hypothetical protein
VISCQSIFVVNEATAIDNAKELLESSMLEAIKRLRKAISSLMLGRNLEDHDSTTVHLLADIVKAYIHMFRTRVSTRRLSK